MTHARGGWLFGRDGTKPGWWGSWRNLNQDLRGKAKGPPWQGQLSLYAGQNDDALHVEWKLGSRSLRACVAVADGERDLRLAVAFPGLALYTGVESKGVGMLLSSLGIRREREVSVSAHDGCIFWKLFADPNMWSEGTPRWRDGSVNLDRLLRGDPVQICVPVVGLRTIEIPLPERTYQAAGTIEEVQIRRDRWPTETFYRATITMHEGEAIPIPGKGESAHDCEDDAIYSSSFPARTLAEAIGEFVGDVLRTREKRARLGWRPPVKDAAPIAGTTA